MTIPVIVSMSHYRCYDNTVHRYRALDIAGLKGNLIGIVRHLEHTGNAGHYNAIVFDQGKWLLCDDHRVSQIEFKDFKYSSTCYLLFYILD